MRVQVLTSHSLEAVNLSKSYGSFTALSNLNLKIEGSKCVGFLGPNGAGKTTTIKMLTGLIAPTSGRATIFDEPIPSPRAMRRVGFLPENPYVYPYLTPREFVEMCGRLSGLGLRRTGLFCLLMNGMTWGVAMGVLAACHR